MASCFAIVRNCSANQAGNPGYKGILDNPAASVAELKRNIGSDLTHEAPRQIGQVWRKGRNDRVVTKPRQVRLESLVRVDDIAALTGFDVDSSEPSVKEKFQLLRKHIENYNADKDWLQIDGDS